MLGNPTDTIFKAAATCVAAIATLEIPAKQWPELIPILTKAAHENEVQFKYAALLTLGYICEDVEPDSINQEEMNDILYALLSNVSAEHMKITAISMKAFSRAALSTERNFKI